MSFWNVSNPAKPKGVKDPDAVLDYPVDFSDWLADIGDTYASHSIIVSDGLTVDSSSESGGIITPILSGGVVGDTETFTVRITTTGGRTDDRTFYLKIVER
jgi:hypothetical protein